MDDEIEWPQLRNYGTSAPSGATYLANKRLDEAMSDATGYARSIRHASVGRSASEEIDIMSHAFRCLLLTCMCVLVFGCGDKDAARASRDLTPPSPNPAPAVPPSAPQFPIVKKEIIHIPKKQTHVTHLAQEYYGDPIAGYFYLHHVNLVVLRGESTIEAGTKIRIPPSKAFDKWCTVPGNLPEVSQTLQTAEQAR